MDYEVMMNGNVKIGDLAPDFVADTTKGKIKLSDNKGKWIVLFSYPGDFNTICTSEIIEFSRSSTYFEERGINLIALSVDSIASHEAWLRDIYTRTGVTVRFPIIADRNAEIARKYGMISSNISNSETTRNVYIIDNTRNNNYNSYVSYGN